MVSRITAAAAIRVHRHARSAFLACAVFMAVVIGGVGLGASWVRDDHQPSITVLGSGSRLSTLIVDGPARLLIASGDDASAFGNALATALRPTSRRIDVILLDGDERSRTVAARVRRDYPDAATFVIGGDAHPWLADLELDADAVITKSTRITLSPMLSITVDPPEAAGDGWRAEIEYATSRVVITAGSRASPIARNEAEVVVFMNRLHGSDSDLQSVRAIVATSSSMSALEETAGANNAETVRYRVVVGDANSARLRFVDGGIQLPSDAVALPSNAN